jgi:amidase
MNTKNSPKTKDIGKNYKLKSKRRKIWCKQNLLEDSIYKLNVEKIVSLGGIAIEFEPAKIDLEGFGTLLNADMRIDLPNYLKQYSSKELTLRTVSDIVAYNKQDSLDKTYGQGRFEKILTPILA